MTLDFENLAPRDVYAWMSNTITPRPIAWVSTISAEGKTNLAPFSYFQAICSHPPTLLFTGTIADTFGNAMPDPATQPSMPRTADSRIRSSTPTKTERRSPRRDRRR